MTHQQTPLSVYTAALMLALGNVIWILLDNQPQPIVDPYVEKIFNLVAGLRESSWLEYPRTLYWASIGPRPPLYQMLAAPFVLVFGRSVDSILIVNSLSLALLSICTYLLAQRFTARRYAVLAMVIVVSFPIQSQLNGLVRPHGLVAAIAALLILQSLRTIESPSTRNAWILATVFLASFTLHPSSVYVLTAPIAMVFICTGFSRDRNKPAHRALAAKFRWSSRLNNPVLLKGLLPAFGVVVIIVGVWIIIKWEQYAGLSQVMSDSFAPKVHQLDLEVEFFDRFGLFPGVLFICGLSALVKRAICAQTSSAESFILICFTLMLAMYHGLVPLKSTYYFLGAASLIAAIAAYGASCIATLIENTMVAVGHRRVVNHAWFALLCLCTIGLYAANNWGLNSRPETMCVYPLKVCGPNNRRSRSPIPADWHIKSLIEPIVNSKKCRQQGCVVKLVSHRPAYFSDEVFTSTMVQYFDRKTRSDDASFYPQRTIKFVRATLQDRSSPQWTAYDYYIYLTEKDHGLIAEDVLYHNGDDVEAELITALRGQKLNNGSQYSEIAKFRLPNEQFAVLVENKGAAF